MPKARVVGDANQAQTLRLGGDEHVVGTDAKAFRFHRDDAGVRLVADHQARPRDYRKIALAIPKRESPSKETVNSRPAPGTSGACVLASTSLTLPASPRTDGDGTLPRYIAGRAARDLEGVRGVRTRGLHALRRHCLGADAMVAVRKIGRAHQIGPPARRPQVPHQRRMRSATASETLAP